MGGPEDAVPSEMSQGHLLCGPTYTRSPEESRSLSREVDGGGRGLGQGSGVCNGDRVAAWEDEKALETDGGDGSTTV